MGSRVLSIGRVDMCLFYYGLRVVCEKEVILFNDDECEYK